MPPIERWPHIRCTYLTSKIAHNEGLNIIYNEHNNICHTRASQDITYNNADKIQEHLDEQEHIWQTSGTSHQDNTGHHLPRWHNSSKTSKRWHFHICQTPFLVSTSSQKISSVATLCACGHQPTKCQNPTIKLNPE